MKDSGGGGGGGVGGGRGGGGEKCRFSKPPRLASVRQQIRWNASRLSDRVAEPASQKSVFIRYRPASSRARGRTGPDVGHAFRLSAHLPLLCADCESGLRSSTHYSSTNQVLSDQGPSTRRRTGTSVGKYRRTRTPETARF